MLVLLEIQGFGLIDQASIEFTSGLNVLTGETGAGKSIIIDALQVALGQRASVELIRFGQEKAHVTAIFNVSGYVSLENKLSEWGISEKETLVMDRALARNGRNICRLNGRLVTLSFYREVGLHLAAFHGQHEQQVLLNPERQMTLLDRYGGEQVTNLKKQVREIYDQWQSAKTLWEKAQLNANNKKDQLELYRYQIEEINKAALSAGEEEELLKERLRLANAEKILSLTEECYDFLQVSKESSLCVLDSLSQSRRCLNELNRLDDYFSPLLATIDNAFYQIEDIGRELINFRENIQVDPEKLQQINDRLNLINNLKRKYGKTIPDLLLYRDETVKKLACLDAEVENISSLEKRISLLEERWHEVAQELTLHRQEASRRLEEEITTELASLEMERVHFMVRFEHVAGISPHGKENIEFYISPNPGEPPRPLAKIASGGELSRVMLAMRAILASSEETPTLIFDEVDTGIGGKTLQAVAGKLSRIAVSTQVICVTHAAQVACQADNHYYIFKETKDNRTNIYVKKMQEEDLIDEIARLLTGKRNQIARRHAQQLLHSALEEKKHDWP